VRFLSLQVDQGDLSRVTAATGAHIQTTVNNLDTKMLGSCAQFEEKQVHPQTCKGGLSILHDTTERMWSFLPIFMLDRTAPESFGL
jgi:hypothetical protein